MGELRQEFLVQTIFHLEALQKEFLNNSDKSLSEDFLRRFFRQLHTIKGTSKTFNLNNLSVVSHEIENLLQALQNNKILQNDETNSAFQKSFEQLLKIAQNYQTNQEVVIPQEFINNLRTLTPDLSEMTSRNLLEELIPQNLTAKLSSPEKNSLNAALEKGQFFYLLEVVFALADFYEGFKQFKQILNENGEVIAVSPGVSQNPTQEICFQIFFVSSLLKVEIEKLVSAFSVTFEFEKNLPKNSFSDDLSGIIARVIADGENIANILNKKVEFESSLDEIKISGKHLILLNEIASHLLRNAIDHGIETSEERIKNGKNPAAKIKISVLNSGDKTLLQIADDGKGIDIEKIIEQAQQKNLIASDQVLAEKEALELIFFSGFSTSETVSEFSGRGIGLDAVKNLVENSNGKIEVETKLGFGTTFSVYLPQF